MLFLFYQLKEFDRETRFKNSVMKKPIAFFFSILSSYACLAQEQQDEIRRDQRFKTNTTFVVKSLADPTASFVMCRKTRFTVTKVSATDLNVSVYHIPDKGCTAFGGATSSVVKDGEYTFPIAGLDNAKPPVLGVAVGLLVIPQKGGI